MNITMKNILPKTPEEKFMVLCLLEEMTSDICSAWFRKTKHRFLEANRLFVGIKFWK